MADLGHISSNIFGSNLVNLDSSDCAVNSIRQILSAQGISGLVPCAGASGTLSNQAIPTEQNGEDLVRHKSGRRRWQRGLKREPANRFSIKLSLFSMPYPGVCQAMSYRLPLLACGGSPHLHLPINNRFCIMIKKIR